MTMATIYPYHNKIEQIKKTSEKERKFASVNIFLLKIPCDIHYWKTTGFTTNKSLYPFSVIVSHQEINLFKPCDRCYSVIKNRIIFYTYISAASLSVKLNNNGVTLLANSCSSNCPAASFSV